MPCQGCGRDAPTKHVVFYQNIGMLVARRMRTVQGNLCKRCIRKQFLSLTGLTLVTGWWGTISVILNPFLILNNVVRYVGTLRLADTADGAMPVELLPVDAPAARLVNPAPSTPASLPTVPVGLAAYRQDIQIRLRGGQTPQEIAAFLAPRTGVSTGQAQAYAESLRGK
jgi:hypothetical protein